MENLVYQYLGLVGGWKLLTIIVLIAADTLLGIGLAVRNRQFAWSKIADFLNTSVLVMFGSYFVLGIAGMAEASLQAAVPVSLALIDVKLIADIVNKLKSIGLAVNP